MENKENKLIDWGEIPKQGSKGVQRLKLEPGEYKVRPIHKLINFWRIWNKHNETSRTVICSDPSNSMVIKKHNLQPIMRYAINIIDRADNTIKILEAPPSVIEGFKSWFKATKKNPSGAKEGGDFAIQVSGQGMKRRYVVTFVEATPLTNDEMANAKQNLYDLEKLYKANSEEEMERILFADKPFDNDNSSGNSNSSSDSSDDIFGSDDDMDSIKF